MELFFLVTVDCDLRCDDIALRQESLDMLLGVFDECGVGGHATWFLNENDFNLTDNHQPFLLEALKREDTIGIHDHLDEVPSIHDLDAIRERCATSRKRIEGWLAANGFDIGMKCHRNGCIVQSEAIYTALRELNYTIVSDVYPGTSGEDLARRPGYDNSHMPVGIIPYRHNEANFKDHESREGHFLHFPLMHMFLRDFDFAKVDEWIRGSQRREFKESVLSWVFHPYEILRQPEKDGIDLEAVGMLRNCLPLLTVIHVSFFRSGRGGGGPSYHFSGDRHRSLTMHTSHLGLRAWQM